MPDFLKKFTSASAESLVEDYIPRIAIGRLLAFNTAAIALSSASAPAPRASFLPQGAFKLNFGVLERDK